ncbi:hypothetical protein [Nitrososphaera sp.]|uniref:hypothetical protein n=1 Tax=Nitrososphaera sp. TaxID=1971748 RepID=UPI002EDA9EB8
MPLAEMKKKRLQLIHRVYELTDNNEHKSVDMWQIGNELGFGEHGREVTDVIVQYLTGEGLIKFTGLGGSIGITHLGIKEVEEALEHPEQPTEHFAPMATVNIIHVGQMNNSQIQAGGVNSTQTANITQSSSIKPEQLTELLQIVSSLKEIPNKADLTPEQKDELNAEIETLASQAKSPKPKSQIIREGLVSVKSILGSIAEGAAIAARIGTLLSGLPS